MMPTTTTTTATAGDVFTEVSYDKEQIRLMEEMCIVVDRDDKAIGADSKKACHLMSNISKGLLHRAFSVFLFDADNRLLLQQRADEKITFPGFFTNTCCSHPLMVGEEREGVQGARIAARRKLEHELGIPISEIELERLQFLTRIHYLAPSDGLWGEHEIDYIFIYQLRREEEMTMIPSPNEVKSVRYVTRSELASMFAQADRGELQMTPWFRLIVESFLYNWWDCLEKGTPLPIENDTIHRM